MRRLKINDFLDPLSSTVRCLPTDTIGHALSLTKNSHKPVFVFDEKGHFRGVVSPYQVLYKNHTDYNAKVGSKLIMPPHLAGHAPLFEAIAFMLSSRMYTLPIFDGSTKPIGAISAKKIFQKLGRSGTALDIISKDITIQDPVIISDRAKVEEAYHRLKEKEVSRLVVVNKQQGLVGIVARSDIQFALIKPTPRQRFHGRGGSKNDAYDDEKVKRGDSPLGNFYVRQVFSVADTTSMPVIVKKLLTAEHNSIVIVNGENHPVGFISLHDILKSLEQILSPDPQIPVSIQKMKGVHLGEDEQIVAELEAFAQKMGERLTLKRIEVHFKEIETSTDKPMVHEVMVIARTKAGKNVIAHAKHKVALSAIQEATKRIKEQVRRSRR